MASHLRSFLFAVSVVVIASCGQSETAGIDDVERLAFAAPPSPTSTTARPTTTEVDRSPKVTLTCPPDESGGWSSYRAEYGADIKSDGFETATIQYGDGKVYTSYSLEDAEQNMFWHTYQAPGSFFISVEVTDPAGRVGRGTCLFNWQEPATYQPAQSPEPRVQLPQPAQAQQCDPNYSGGCVPIDSDVDCAGGSGNGPSYVRGPVYVVGSDVYGLDRDNDGVGCE